MKKLAKLLALLLALTMMLSLAACKETDEKNAGANTTEAANSIVGSWKFTLNLDKALAVAGDTEELQGLEELGDSFMEMMKELSIVMVLDLKADDTYTFQIDEDSAKEAISSMMSKMKEIFPKLMADMLGMSEEDVMAQLEAAGTSVDSLMEQAIGQMDTDQMLKDMTKDSSKGTYRFADGKLFLTEEGKVENPADYAEVELNGNELKITKLADNESFESLKDLLPLVFVR